MGGQGPLNNNDPAQGLHILKSGPAWLTVTQRRRQFVETANGILQLFAEQLELRRGAVLEAPRHVQRHRHVGRNARQLRLQIICIRIAIPTCDFLS